MLLARAKGQEIMQEKKIEVHVHSKVRDSGQVLSSLALKIILCPLAPTPLNCFDIDGAAFTNNLRESWVQCPKEPISMVTFLIKHFLVN